MTDELAAVRTELKSIYSRVPTEAERTIQTTEGPVVKAITKSVIDQWRRAKYSELKRRERELLSA